MLCVVVNHGRDGLESFAVLPQNIAHTAVCFVALVDLNMDHLMRTPEISRF